MRARTPIKGLRQRLRVALKAAGATGKFSVDLMRNGSLLVRCESAWSDKPLHEFEGHAVTYGLRVRGESPEKSGW